MTFTASHLLFGKNDIPRRWKDVRQSNLMQLFMDFITLKKFGTHRWMKTWIVSTRQIILSMFFALRTRSANGITVRPSELSRTTKFLLNRGGVISAVLSSTHYNRSPLVQGGMETPSKASVTMMSKVKNV